MSGPKEGPNPLRPYYIPPSVGPPPGSGTNSSAPKAGPNKYGPSATNAKSSFGSSARDILSDLKYSDYLSDNSPSAVDVVKGLLDQAVWKYTSVLLAQPFEVAKTILQVQLATIVEDGSGQKSVNEEKRRRPRNHRGDAYEVPSDDSDGDSSSYFTSAAPLSHTLSRSPGRDHRSQRYQSSRSPSPSTTPLSSSRSSASRPHHVPPTTSLTSVLSHLWTSEGAWGIYKGANTTFIHNVLLSTITAFARSLLCALLAIPDPGLSISQSSPSHLIPIPSAVGGLDILSSPSPFLSLAAAVSAAGIASIILAPVDIARTKLVLTPSTHPPRSLIPTLQSLPSWTLPFSIAPVTFLHSTLPTFISASTPLFLRSRMGIDPVLTPSMYAIATFVSQTVELGIKLPIETVLRRGQMAILTSASSSPPRNVTSASSLLPSYQQRRPIDTVVDLGPYKGLSGTLYHIVFEEGERHGSSSPTTPASRLSRATSATPGSTAKKSAYSKHRKGQGLEGLFRGWRVGIWGLVGVWGAATLGGVGGKGGEF